MSNFAFLKTQSAYASFAPACVEAEGVLCFEDGEVFAIPFVGGCLFGRVYEGHEPRSYWAAGQTHKNIVTGRRV